MTAWLQSQVKVIQEIESGEKKADVSGIQNHKFNNRDNLVLTETKLLVPLNRMD
jgi:hypothetical protein